MLIFWKAFVCRKWQKQHQNEGFLPQNEFVFDRIVPFFEVFCLVCNSEIVLYIIVLQTFRQKLKN